MIPPDVANALGLSPNEVKLYGALVVHGPSTVGELAASGQVHRRNAYDAITRLLEKGLCFQIFSTTDHRYSAVDPGKLTELLAERQKQLDLALPTLLRQYHAQPKHEEAFIFRGVEGQRNIWREILRVGEDVYNLGAKAQWFDPRLAPWRTAFLRDMTRQAMTLHLLFDHEVRTRFPDMVRQYPPRMKYRFRYLPKAYSTNSVVNIFGEYVVMFTGIELGAFREETTFFVIRSADLATSYRTWFRYLWSQSTPGPSRPGRPVSPR